MCFGINESSQCRIQWTEPANNDSFDLDHYQLSVGSDIMNIDAKENTVIISVPTVANISLGIIAVDRCGVKSASSNITLPVNSSNYCTDSIVKPSTNLTQQKNMTIPKTCAQSSGVSAAFAILALIIIVLFITSIVLTIIIILSRKSCVKVDLSKWNVVSIQVIIIYYTHYIITV